MDKSLSTDAADRLEDASMALSALTFLIGQCDETVPVPITGITQLLSYIERDLASLA